MSSTTTTGVALVVDETGIHAPDFPTVLGYFYNGARGIYGSDLYLGNDSPDAQLLAMIATAMHDCNSSGIAVYNSFSPATAVGAGLSSVVKINGIQRLVPTYSTVPLTITGRVGTQIINGAVRDQSQQTWLLPAVVTIPSSASIIVTATAENVGAIQAGIGTITSILTPTYGWDTATNAVAATPGAPVETNAQLRQRQSVSTALPAQSIGEALQGMLLNINGVDALRVYVNDSDAVDDSLGTYSGVPNLGRHSIAVVIDGGDGQTISDTIFRKKDQGVTPWGSTYYTTIDQFGIPHQIGLTRPVRVPIRIVVTLHPLLNYTTTIGNNLMAAILAYAQGSLSRIGLTIYKTWIYRALGTDPTYDIFDIAVTRVDNVTAPDSHGNLVLPWNALPTYDSTNISIVLA